MGRRSVRLSRSARLLPIPSSSFSSEAEAEAEELELLEVVGVVELTKVLLTEAPVQEPRVVVSSATGFRLEAPPGVMLPACPLLPGPCCPCEGK